MTQMKNTKVEEKTYVEYNFDGTLIDPTSKSLTYPPIWNVLVDSIWHDTLYVAGWYFIDETQNVYEKKYDSFDEAIAGMNEYAIRELGC